MKEWMNEQKMNELPNKWINKQTIKTNWFNQVETSAMNPHLFILLPVGKHSFNMCFTCDLMDMF